MATPELDALIKAVKQQRPRPRLQSAQSTIYLVDVDRHPELLSWMRQYLPQIASAKFVGGCACCVLDLQLEAEADAIAALLAMHGKPAWDGQFQKRRHGPKR